jgi:hypothetical protein
MYAKSGKLNDPATETDILHLPAIVTENVGCPFNSLISYIRIMYIYQAPINNAMSIDLCRCRHTYIFSLTYFQGTVD